VLGKLDHTNLNDIAELGHTRHRKIFPNFYMPNSLRPNTESVKVKNHGIESPMRIFLIE
jgi:hypothetical protein